MSAVCACGCFISTVITTKLTSQDLDKLLFGNLSRRDLECKFLCAREKKNLVQDETCVIDRPTLQPAAGKRCCVDKLFTESRLVLRVV